MMEWVVSILRGRCAVARTPVPMLSVGIPSAGSPTVSVRGEFPGENRMISYPDADALSGTAMQRRVQTGIRRKVDHAHQPFQGVH